MPRIADYSVIRDTKFTLEIGSDIDKDFDFTLESGASLRSSSILAFVVFLPKDGVAFEVKINGTSVITYNFNFNTSSVHTLHEVIDASILKAGTNNIEFRVTSGAGALTVGDVVLLYQRDI